MSTQGIDQLDLILFNLLKIGIQINYGTKDGYRESEESTINL